MLNARLLFLSAVVALSSTPVHAHGQEVLATVYAQILTVIVCCAVSLFWAKRFAKPRFGIVGCIVGVVLSWAVTGSMPFGENALLITAIQVVFPAIGTAIGVFIAKNYANDNRRI